MATETAHVALGANLAGPQGEPLQTLRWALQTLGARVGRVVAVSKAYRTVALGMPGAAPAPDYWNAACAVQTALEPEGVLAALMGIEAEAGRVRRERWLSRTLDLDLLLFGESTIHTATLDVPHPYLAERVFVLRPLTDIAADVLVPGTGVSVQSLLARLPDPQAGVKETRPVW